MILCMIPFAQVRISTLRNRKTVSRSVLRLSVHLVYASVLVAQVSANLLIPELDVLIGEASIEPEAHIHNKDSQ